MSEYCGQMITSYMEDEKIFKTRTIRICVFIIAVCTGLLPLFASSYQLHLLITMGITILGAIGLNFITGYTGMISLGHGAFIGVGAYTTAILSSKLGIPFFITLPAAGFMTAAIGMFFGMPSLRIKGLYLLMATLAAQVIINFLMVNWEGLTMGVNGYPVEPASIAGFIFDTEKRFFYLTFGIVLVGIWVAANIRRSRYGRAFIAIRDYDIAAEVIGVRLFKYKTLAFAIGSFYAGIAGALMAHYSTLITPEHFPLSLSIEYLAIIIVGGMGSILGSIYGAIFLTLLPEFLKVVMEGFFGRFFPGAFGLVPFVNSILFGLIIILFLIAEPDGLVEIHRRIKKYFKLWPFAY